MRVPVELKKWMDSLDDKIFFITSLDRRTASIYPIAVWEENEKLLLDYKDNPDAGERLNRLAAALGSEEEIDTQGRILISPQLRKALNLLESPVHLYYNAKGRIDIVSEADHAASLEGTEEASADDLRELRKAGLR